MITIDIDIADANSVRNAIAELKEVRAEWLRKCNLLCETVAAMLADEIERNLSEIPFTDDVKDIGSHQAVEVFPMFGVEARGNTVVVAGAEIAFVEFGAGAYYNGTGSNNPLATEVSFDTATGSYGKGHGNEKYWFIAHNLISCGTPAYMPVYRAIEAVKPQIPTIARGIFV